MPTTIKMSPIDWKWTLNLDNFITCRDLGGRPNRGGNRAVFCIGELDRVGNGAFQNSASLHDMVDVEFNEFSGMILNPFARNLDVISGHILPLFEQYRYNIGSRAGSNRYQKHLE